MLPQLQSTALFVLKFIPNRLSFVNGFLEIFAQKHEHIFRSVALVGNIDHENNAILSILEIVLISTDEFPVTFGVEDIKGRM